MDELAAVIREALWPDRPVGGGLVLRPSYEQVAEAVLREQAAERVRSGLGGWADTCCPFCEAEGLKCPGVTVRQGETTLIGGINRAACGRRHDPNHGFWDLQCARGHTWREPRVYACAECGWENWPWRARGGESRGEVEVG